MRNIGMARKRLMIRNWAAKLIVLSGVGEADFNIFVGSII